MVVRPFFLFINGSDKHSWANMESSSRQTGKLRFTNLNAIINNDISFQDDNYFNWTWKTTQHSHGNRLYLIDIVSVCQANCTGSWSHWGAKLRDWAVVPVRAGCYSWAALSLNDSKTLYTSSAINIIIVIVISSIWLLYYYHSNKCFSVTTTCTQQCIILS